MLTLVTGLDGFTGRHVESELVAHGHKVIGLSSDLTDALAVAQEIAQIQPEAVVHLAGVSFVAHGEANLFYEVNLLGTRNLLEALTLYAPNVRSVLLASSANIYGNKLEGILSETATPDPVNDYAVSKFAMEQMARLWLDRLPLFIVRPFNYTGVGQDERFLIPKIVAHFCNKKATVELGNLDVWREFGDVRAVAGIYRRLLEYCPVGLTLNVCTSQTYSLRKVIAMCEAISGHSINIQINQSFVRNSEVRVLTGDNSRLKSVIGDWQLYSLEDTLRWMLDNDEVALN